MRQDFNADLKIYNNLFSHKSQVIYYKFKNKKKQELVVLSILCLCQIQWNAQNKINVL